MKKLFVSALVIAGFFTPLVHAAPPAAIRIEQINPPQGPVGTLVDVFGFGFSPKNNAVNFAGATRAVTGLEAVTMTDGPEPNEMRIRFSIPATPCTFGHACDQVVLRPGDYKLSVTNAGGYISNSVSFTVTPGVAAPLPPPVPPSVSKSVKVTAESAEKGTPISNATVTFVDNKGVTLATMITDKEGVVRFEKRTAALDLITIEAKGYETARISGQRILTAASIPVKLSLTSSPSRESRPLLPAPARSQGIWARLLHFFFGWRANR